MKQKFLAILVVIVALISLPIFSYAQNLLTYEEALEKVYQNQENIDVYKELIEELRENAKKVEKNPLTNTPNYEYVEGNEIAMYDFGRTFDYEKAANDRDYELKTIKRDLEFKTLDLYTSLVKSKEELSEKNILKQEKEKELKIARLKYELGMSVKTDMLMSEDEYSAFLNEIQNMSRSEQILKERLNFLMGVNKGTSFEVSTENLLTLVDIDGESLLMPKEALEFAVENKKSLTDVKKDVENLKKDLDRFSRIYPPGTYYYNEREKELDKLIESADDMKEQQLFAFEKAYLRVITSIEAINKDELEIEKKHHEINYYENLYKAGQISEIEILKKRNEINSLKRNQLITTLGIKKTILEYQKSFF